MHISQGISGQKMKILIFVLIKVLGSKIFYFALFFPHCGTIEKEMFSFLQHEKVALWKAIHIIVRDLGH